MTNPRDFQSLTLVRILLRNFLVFSPAPLIAGQNVRSRTGNSAGV